jgi:phenylalanyl-tRNA synthetase beta chain
MSSKFHGTAADTAVDAEDDIIYKLDIPANRYDLLCMEGISKVGPGRYCSPRQRMQ